MSGHQDRISFRPRKQIATVPKCSHWSKQRDGDPTGSAKWDSQKPRQANVLPLCHALAIFLNFILRDRVSAVLPRLTRNLVCPQAGFELVIPLCQLKPLGLQAYISRPSNATLSSFFHLSNFRRECRAHRQILQAAHPQCWEGRAGFRLLPGLWKGQWCGVQSGTLDSCPRVPPAAHTQSWRPDPTLLCGVIKGTGPSGIQHPPRFHVTTPVSPWSVLSLTAPLLVWWFGTDDKLSSRVSFTPYFQGTVGLGWGETWRGRAQDGWNQEWGGAQPGLTQCGSHPLGHPRGWGARPRQLMTWGRNSLGTQRAWTGTPPTAGSPSATADGVRVPRSLQAPLLRLTPCHTRKATLSVLGSQELRRTSHFPSPHTSLKLLFFQTLGDLLHHTRGAEWECIQKTGPQAVVPVTQAETHRLLVTEDSPFPTASK